MLDHGRARGMHRTWVGLEVGVDRGGNGDEDDIGRADPGHVAAQLQPAVVEGVDEQGTVAGQQVHGGAGDGGEPALGDVQADDREARGLQGQRGRQADITETDDGDGGQSDGRARPARGGFGERPAGRCENGRIRQVIWIDGCGHRVGVLSGNR
jgi:hypothetical protein